MMAWVTCVGFVLVLAPLGGAKPSIQEASESDAATLVVIVGAGGEAEYAEQFQHWAQRMESALAVQIGRRYWIGPRPPAEEGDDADGSPPPSTAPKLLPSPSDRAAVEQVITTLQGDATAPLWLVYFGHATDDGRTAKLNLRGPDLGANELAGWMRAVRRPTALVLCSSCSGAFLPLLSGPDRVVVTATRSGQEYSFSRFGEWFSRSFSEDRADLDRDAQVSLLEAFLFASRAVAEHYEGQGLLATEHALLDDNGDGRGTPASWFRGVRCDQIVAESGLPDGTRAHQIHWLPSPWEAAQDPEWRQQRDQLERALEALRARRGQLEDGEYYGRLEEVALRLARWYEQARPVAVETAPAGGAAKGR